MIFQLVSSFDLPRAFGKHRLKHAGPQQPKLFEEDLGGEDDLAMKHLFAEYCEMSSQEQRNMKKKVEHATVSLGIPSFKDRQAWNAQDPLASVHHYLVHMKVFVPLAFGIRMCFQCPHCNWDRYEDARNPPGRG